MKKLIHYIIFGDPNENPWEWFLKCVAIPYLFVGLIIMLFVWPQLLKS